jgi:hypothetical protein
MFRHVVMFSWIPAATEEQRAEVATRLLALRPEIPQIRSMHVGSDAGVNDGNHDFAVVADFDSVDDYLIYRDHPGHQAVIAAHIKPIVAARAAVQYEI